MSKVFVLVTCQPGKVPDTMRSLRALAREDPAIAVEQLAYWRHHIMVTIASEDDELLIARLMALKNINGVVKVEECFVGR